MNRQPGSTYTLPSAGPSIPEDSIHYFLWASHGNNVSPSVVSNELYPTKFGRFDYFADHGESALASTLDQFNIPLMEKAPNNTRLSNFPPFSYIYNGVDIRQNIGGKIRIPPLIFTIEPDPLSVVAPCHGLYYFRLSKYLNLSLFNIQFERLMAAPPAYFNLNL